MGESKVHNIRFYNVEPKAIHCLSYEPDRRKLALSRADSSIEIWDTCYTAHLERVIPGRPNGSVEALAWCSRRLFSTGINARITEYDLQSLLPKYEVPVTAGAAWCLGVNRQKTHVAAGTEDGYINVFSILDDCIQYEKILDKQEGRILCMAWDASGDMLVTGSLDAVRIWNVHTGHALHKMTTGRSEAQKETIVWCVAVTDDFTIISGDSRGKVCFWNGHNGTSIESYKTHDADVLCLALSDDQTTLYCSGVDPLIATFSRINMRTTSGQNGVINAIGSVSQAKPERSQWCRSANRRIHEHDVRAMAMCHGKLFSGGIDAYLAMSSYPPKVLIRYPPILPSCVSICPESRSVLLRYTSHLEVWRLGTSLESTGTPSARSRQRRHSGDGGALVNGKHINQQYEGRNVSANGPLPLSEDPVKLIELRTKRNEQIVCAALSSNGKWLTYSTATLIRIFSVDMSSSEPKLEKVSLLPEEFNTAHRLKFSPDSSNLVLVNQQRQIHIFQLNAQDSSVCLKQTLPTEKLLRDVIYLLAISEDGRYIVAGDHQSYIAVWKDGKHYCSLPHYKCGATALAINSQTLDVVVTYSDQKIVEYSLKEKKFTQFSRKLDQLHPKQWLARSFVVNNITFDPRNSSIIILHDDNTICVIDKRKTLAPVAAKIPRLDPPAKSDAVDEKVHPGTCSPQFAFHVIKRYKHLVHVEWLGGDEMALVEVNPLRLAKQLPPAMTRKRFGV